jgi:rubrerythrin
LAEEVAELDGHPDIERTALSLEGDTAQMLQADIEAERAVTMDYNRQLGEIEDEELHKLLTRIRDHEIYHDELFSDMLAEVKATEAKPKAEPEAEPELPAPEEPPSPLGKLTVGSLMKSDK